MLSVERAIEILRIRNGLVAKINIDVLEAYNMAIKALSKDIKVKVIDPYACPVCNHFLADEHNFQDKCDECGQSLDWSNYANSK